MLGKKIFAAGTAWRQCSHGAIKIQEGVKEKGAFVVLAVVAASLQ